MGEGSANCRGRKRFLLAAARPRWSWLLAAVSACSLDFAVGDRAFQCPAQVLDCLVCNADGSCREPLQAIEQAEPGPPNPPASPPALATPDAAVVQEQPPPPVLVPSVPGVRDAGSAPLDAGVVEPPPNVCTEYASRSSDSLCLNGDEQCFSLGSVLSPALVAWLDPTTLPSDGSRYWCDRSGQRHHALLQPDASAVVIEPDGRAVGEVLARSLLLERSWLSLSPGREPVLVAGNFAVVLAAAGLSDAAPPSSQPDAAPPPPPSQPFELFESGQVSRINLTLVPSTGRLEGRITSSETALIPAPVITQSSVYDGAFHLYSLHRRSEVRVLDDVLQLRLNGALEFRGSSIAIPRALDLSSGQPPRLGSRSSAAGPSTTGRARIAAAILFRGAVPEDELARLENFLCEALAVCGAPALPPLPAPPPLPAR